MSYKKAVLLYAIALLLQFSLLNIFSINDVTPNLILCLMIFITYKYNDGFKPALIALPFALLSDMMGGQYVGISALVLFILGLTVNYFGKGLNRETLWTLAVVSAFGTVFYNFLYWLIMSLLGNPSNILDLLRFIAIALPANLVVILIVFFVYTRIYRKIVRPTGYAIVDMRPGLNKRKNKMSLRNTR